jgi:hypothetical protein
VPVLVLPGDFFAADFPSEDGVEAVGAWAGLRAEVCFSGALAAAGES